MIAQLYQVTVTGKTITVVMDAKAHGGQMLFGEPSTAARNAFVSRPDPIAGSSMVNTGLMTSPMKGFQT